MKKLVLLVSLLLAGLVAGAQELHCTFTSTKTIKAVHKDIKGSGTVVYRAPDYMSMIYDTPEGEYLIIDGNTLKNCVAGKAVTVDTSKNAFMRNLRNTLINCVNGDYETAAKENDASLIVEEKNGIKTVTLLARKKAVKGYAGIIVDYNAKGLPVRMVLDEFSGIVTEFRFSY